jgi:hypothetical protein
MTQSLPGSRPGTTIALTGFLPPVYIEGVAGGHTSAGDEGSVERNEGALLGAGALFFCREEKDDV